MTYTAVNGILTDRDPALLERYAPLVPMFELMHELFQILNDARRRRGSIDFDLNEAEVIIDEGGVVEAIIALERNVAHRLIEEFMLLANETVASLSRGAGRAGALPHPRGARRPEGREVRGVHLGLRLQPRARRSTALRPRHFQKLLERIHGKPEEKPIAFLMLRTMQKARYAPENLGHFGLAAPSYTHFTSPIRRYPDLVVHRALRAARHASLTDETREEWTEELPEIARHTSEMERRADDAERELLQWKKVKFMADKVGDEFEGYVTGVAAFGLFVELDRALRRRAGPRLDDGRRLLPVRRAARTCCAARTRRRSIAWATRCAVQVIRVNMELRQIDLGLVEILERVREGERGPRRSKATPKAEKRRKQRPGRRERQRPQGQAAGTLSHGYGHGDGVMP